ncbi:2-oxoglutarate dehydrogenase E1 component [Immundisolibacter sp.]|uniref:2-oxoglutarate dehydrogenase E1 component n=1 Tax=Immundisolibacter sp. TaxID=1934948 RepID=UPI0026321EEE|nr:2-oxoglutarate dehydrogenase E1 component [Immundisolibacter sp.]MDD3651583.1 2-oxoglutarate dehydrogenase E1 component [Immundisolibacter sp.]
MDVSSGLGFGSASFVEALYEEFLADPTRVPEAWRREFESWGAPPAGPAAPSHGAVQQRLRELAAHRRTAAVAPPATTSQRLHKQNAVQQLINEYRQRGHLAARTDPLELQPVPPVPSLSLDYHGLTQADLDATFSPGNFPLPAGATLRDLVSALEATYCGAVGFEYAYLSDSQQVEWLRQRIEAGRGRATLTVDEQRQIMRALTAAEGLERYLHRRYVGQKRFSLEGGDGLIAVLEELVRRAGSADVKELVIGMAHRGRLNVLVNILGKQPRELFAEFEGKAEVVGSGDVKYHQGFSADPVTPGGPIHLTLAFNPSHLEIIDPVVEGSVRARQERRGDLARRQVLPLLIHGDAAFAGQGVVMETLNLAKTRGYATGGTLHIVVNNQIGFTTSNPSDARSTYYCTEIAHLTQAPIFHVNGDDPEALLFVTRLALDFRLTFGSDVVIDLVCYRRQGHNEADEPAITQPRMYAKISRHPTVRELYARRLESAGVLAPGEAARLAEDYQRALERGECVAPWPMSDQRPLLAIDWAPHIDAVWTEPAVTGVPIDTLRRLGEKLCTVPAGFKLHPRVAKILDDRRQMTAGEQPLDWGCAETLAYATLLLEGQRVRLSGQDSGRGTFAHRHAVLHNQDLDAPEDLQRYVPLQHLQPGQPSFLVIDSPLSEEAVLGFEYGYASADPHTLVIWEAQFGDFANGAQVVIDQFISSSEAKWQRLCGMALFLPHGYEGQGPEHSSARLERYLQLCAEQNMQVCVPSTPAQMFHMLRRQMLRRYRRPLVVMTPKSLLRHRLSVSTLQELAQGEFALLIGDPRRPDPARVRRVLLCSGKVYYDLYAAREERGIDDIAIVRIEQLYPFPKAQLSDELARYGTAAEVIWVQEEPLNQGAWYQIRHKLVDCLAPGQALRYIGRPRSAAPACGSYALHLKQQQALVDDALAPAKAPAVRQQKSA